MLKVKLNMFNRFGKIVFLLFCFLTNVSTKGQTNGVDVINSATIQTVRLFQQNNQLSAPVIQLNSNDIVELHFDELGTQVKNYSYTYELCNANWEPANLSKFDYIRGFQQQRIFQYRNSSIAQVNYVHYTINLPERSCMPTKSGNYLLKVFANGNEKQVVFTKRLLVVNNIAAVGLQVLQPFNASVSQTHQKLNIVVDATKLNAANLQQQVQIAVVKNYNWNDAYMQMQPAFIRGKVLEYNAEQDAVFAGGKEYRWVDLRSFRFSSDRIASINKDTVPNSIYLFTDGSRVQQRYLFYRDLNGMTEISSTESVNTWWQTDYAFVKFTYAHANNKPLPANTKLYLNGELVNNSIGEGSEMIFNEQKGLYEKTLLLKQGFYTYQYITQTGNEKPNTILTEGNNWETENHYTVLVYYRSFSGRHDELVGLTTTNSRAGRMN